MAARFSPGKLFLVSFSILFLEMASIRWLNAAVNALAYFNNLIPISCFLGLGVGCLLDKLRTSLIRWYPVALLIFVAAVLFLKRYAIDISYTDDVIFASGFDPEQGLFRLSFSVLAGFTVNTVLFVLLGQELGKQLAAMGDAIRAYAYDIAGRLLGVLIYPLLAWAGTPPHVWFGLGGLLLLAFLGDGDGRSRARGSFSSPWCLWRRATRTRAGRRTTRSKSTPTATAKTSTWGSSSP